MQTTNLQIRYLSAGNEIAGWHNVGVVVVLCRMCSLTLTVNELRYLEYFHQIRPVKDPLPRFVLQPSLRRFSCPGFVKLHGIWPRGLHLPQFGNKA